ncbi:MAG: hypothetical protein ACM3H8_14665 [Sphingobacteriales bacterium]
MVGVKNSSADRVLEFQYYTDKPRQDGDYSVSLHEFLLGYEVFRCKNLLKSVGDVVYKYDFDAGGKIISVSYSSPYIPSTVIYKYAYECK